MQIYILIYIIYVQRRIQVTNISITNISTKLIINQRKIQRLLELVNFLTDIQYGIAMVLDIISLKKNKSRKYST